MMSARTQLCFVSLLWSLTSAEKTLDSISDLKKIKFGEYVPKHSLILLYWFANAIDIDDFNRMRLTFDVTRGDFGSHYYRNSESLLRPPPSGYRYYTIGNLYQDQSRQLPNYVVNPPRQYVGENRNRIIIRVQSQNMGHGREIIDEVYITQHRSDHQASSYSSLHTYRVTTNLLRQLRVFCVRENQLQLSQLRNQFGSKADDFQLRQIRSMWPGYAGLGLLMFIVIEEKNRDLAKLLAVAGVIVIIIILFFFSSILNVKPK